MVVVVAPEPQHRAGMAERHEQRLVEALVTQAAVEALDIAVLLRLVRRDVVPLDRSLLRPSQDRQAGQLGAVVAHDHQRRSSSDGDDGVELTSDTPALQCAVGHTREPLVRTDYDYVTARDEHTAESAK